jgi:hypothetical protein
VSLGRFAASLAVALLLAAAGERRVTAQRAFPSHDVRIEIAIDANRLALVREQYVLTRPLNGFEHDTRIGNSDGANVFEFLAPPCARVGPITASIDGRTATLRADAETRAPWISLIVPPTLIAAAGVWGLEYAVRLEGAMPFVPIVMPSATLEHVEGARGAAVAIEVTFPSQPDARILIPQLHRSGSGWQGQFLAIPSSVRAALPDFAAVCDAAIGGTTGGLEWRVALFAGTMAAWVPLYLWLFGRKRWPERG